jgi:hypothetical protein
MKLRKGRDRDVQRPFFMPERKTEMVTMMKEAAVAGAGEMGVSERGGPPKSEDSIDPSLEREMVAEGGQWSVSVSQDCSDRGILSGNGNTPPSRKSAPPPLDGEELCLVASSAIAVQAEKEASVPRAGNGRFMSRGKGANRVPAKRKRVRKASKAAPLVWTAEKRSAFLAALAATSNVTKSATAAGMSDAQVYAERRRNAGFREAWTDALSEGYARLEFMMLERASEAMSDTGAATDEKVAVNKMHEYSNKLALNLLTAHRALVREARSGAAPSRRSPNRVAGSKARLIAKLDEMRARSSG